MSNHARETTDPRTVLVTGATGKVGRHLVDALLAARVRVRALTRHPLLAGLPEAVEVVTGDLTRPDTLAGAARGTDAAFLLWPGFDASAASATVDALARDVDRIVYLSAAQLQDGRSGVTEGPWAEVEAAMRASGVAWTFLRGGGFAGNALEWAPAIRAGTPVRLPHPEAVRSPVHERDIADVAAVTLLDPGHDGQAYDLTGPEQLSMREQVAILGEAVGRPVEVHHLTPAEAQAEMTARMGPEYATAALTYWGTLVGSPERTAPDVERVTGRPARTFATWARDHVDDFRAPDTDEVARRYADGFRTGDVAAATAMLAPDVVRVAPLETGGEEVEVRGLAAITEHAVAQNAGIEMAGVEVSAPMVGPDAFAIRFRFDERVVATGAPRRTEKISMCTVEAGRIVREEVFYYRREDEG